MGKRSAKSTLYFQTKQLTEDDSNAMLSIVERARANYDSFAAGKPARFLKPLPPVGTQLAHYRKKALKLLLAVQDELASMDLPPDTSDFDKYFRAHSRELDRKAYLTLPRVMKEFFRLGASPDPRLYCFAKEVRGSPQVRTWLRLVEAEEKLMVRRRVSDKDTRIVRRLKVLAKREALRLQLAVRYGEKWRNSGEVDPVMDRLWPLFAREAKLLSRHREEVRESTPFFSFCRLVFWRALGRDMSLKALSARWRAKLRAPNLSGKD